MTKEKDAQVWGEGFAAGRWDASTTALLAVENLEEVFYTSEWGPVIRRSTALKAMRDALGED